MTHLSRALALLASLALLSPSVGAAQLATGGMDLRLFRPSLDSKGLLVSDGTDVLGHLDVSFGLVLDGGFGLVRVDAFRRAEETSAASAERAERLVDSFITGTLHGNLGIVNRLVVGLQLPIMLASGPAVELPGFYGDGTGLDLQGVGDLSLHVKARLLRAERDPLGLAVSARVSLPTGDATRFGGAPSVTLWPNLALEWQPVRRFRLVANAGYRAVLGSGATLPVGSRTEPSESNATGAAFTNVGTPLTHDDALTFSLGFGARVGDSIEFLVEAYGAQIASELGESGSLSIEAIAGAKIFVADGSYLQLGGGLGLTDGLLAADYRGTVGFVFEPSVGDRDGDGYRDDVDECPDQPEDFDNFVDEDGCPDPDNDRDLILDDDDECPMVPEDRDGDADEDGCPEGGEGDRDGDGIVDPMDGCPDDPEDRDGFQDEDGCPDPDNDEDGRLDTDDLCPNDPEDMDGFQDADGCPDHDNDGDRILDVDDTCPNDPEEYNGFEDEDGCPDRGILYEGEGGFVLLEKVQFETDSAEILPSSRHILDAITAALVGHQEIQRVEIQGHADERGNDEYNLRLTRDRAAAVLEALVQRGVLRDRLQSAGYGELCPLESGHDRHAWEINRRVELTIRASESGNTNTRPPCEAGRDYMP
ncbi:MAG: OOP family OmpA-OmpF porin [Polyangiales bacterium]|jgi:OOP family OmpA-OmpF porin